MRRKLMGRERDPVRKGVGEKKEMGWRVRERERGKESVEREREREREREIERERENVIDKEIKIK